MHKAIDCVCKSKQNERFFCAFILFMPIIADAVKYLMKTMQEICKQRQGD